jgi:pyruvate kinase
MTDVANAVFDGADATMLSGETANGAFPAKAVATMAAIAANSELGVDYWAQYNFLRRCIAGTAAISPLEASLANVAKTAVEYSADKDGDGVIDADEGTAIIVITESGRAADLITKYRPPCPVFVATSNASVAHHTNTRFGQIPCLLDSANVTVQAAVDAAAAAGAAAGVPFEGRRILVVASPAGGSADEAAVMSTVTLSIRSARQSIITPAQTAPMHTSYTDPGTSNSVLSLRSTQIGLDLILNNSPVLRKTKIVCTMGPKCWSEQGMRALLANGMGVARFNFSHGTHEAHQEVLDRYRVACKAEGAAMKVGTNKIASYSCSPCPPPPSRSSSIDVT